MNFTQGMEVDVRRRRRFQHWLTGVIESVPDTYRTGWEMIAVRLCDDETTEQGNVEEKHHFHPWNFDCLRPHTC